MTSPSEKCSGLKVLIEVEAQFFKCPRQLTNVKRKDNICSFLGFLQRKKVNYTFIFILKTKLEK